MGSRIVHPPNILTLWACVCALSQCVRDSMSFTARVRRIPLRVGFDFSFFSSDEILSVRASDRVGPVGGLTFRVRMRIFSAAANRITRYSFLKKMIRLGYFFNQPITMKKKIRFFTSSEVRGVFYKKDTPYTVTDVEKKDSVSLVILLFRRQNFALQKCAYFKYQWIGRKCTFIAMRRGKTIGNSPVIFKIFTRPTEWKKFRFIFSHRSCNAGKTCCFLILM